MVFITPDKHVNCGKVTGNCIQDPEVLNNNMGQETDIPIKKIQSVGHSGARL